MLDEPSSPEPTSAGDLTRLLQEAAGGESAAAERLLPLIYEQLRAIANRRMSSERADHTLQATALVHEAYLRLMGNARIEWASRAHFFHAAAEAMRRILIEHARHRARLKRGGSRSRRPIERVDLAVDHDPDEILALDAAICRLEERDPRAARIVRLRFFAGLSVEETAEALDLAPRTIKRDWAAARAWLFREMQAAPD